MAKRCRLLAFSAFALFAAPSNAGAVAIVCDLGQPVLPCELDTRLFDSFAGNHDSRLFYPSALYQSGLVDGNLSLRLLDLSPAYRGLAYLSAPVDNPAWVAPWGKPFYFFGAFNGANVPLRNGFEWLGADAARTLSSGRPGSAALAAFAQDAYTSQPSLLSGYIPVDSVRTGNGFSATAYRNNDSLVVAIRGTDLPHAAAKNALADVSWVSPDPSLQMRSYAAAAAQFVVSVTTRHPGLEVALTGHSLGGALAQLVGQASHYRTETFNAPGPAKLLAALGDELQPLASLPGRPDAASIVNLRLYGDPVSLLGEQLGSTVTVGIPSTMQALAYESLSWASLHWHSIDLLASQLATGAPTSPGIDGAWLLKLGENFVIPLLASNGNLQFRLDALSGLFYMIDPIPGSSYQLMLADGSPDIDRVGLPQLPGVAQWRVSTFADGAWSDPFAMAGLTEADVLGAVRGLRLTPLTANGTEMFNPTPFTFGLAFATSGEVLATIAVTVPEPGTLGMLCTGILLLASLRDRREHRG